MDPIITTAIVAAIAGVSSNAIKDSYEALKGAIKKKFGEKSDLVDAINKLEKTPDRADRKATVQAEVKIAKADEDSELRQLAQELLSKLKEQPDRQQGNINIGRDAKGVIAHEINGGTFTQGNIS